jgi:hypothetical protein
MARVPRSGSTTAPPKKQPASIRPDGWDPDELELMLAESAARLAARQNAPSWDNTIYGTAMTNEPTPDGWDVEWARRRAEASSKYPKTEANLRATFAESAKRARWTCLASSVERLRARLAALQNAPGWKAPSWAASIWPDGWDRDELELMLAEIDARLTARQDPDELELMLAEIDVCLTARQNVDARLAARQNVHRAIREAVPSWKAASRPSRQETVLLPSRPAPSSPLPEKPPPPLHRAIREAVRSLWGDCIPYIPADQDVQCSCYANHTAPQGQHLFSTAATTPGGAPPRGRGRAVDLQRIRARDPIRARADQAKQPVTCGSRVHSARQT